MILSNLPHHLVLILNSQDIMAALEYVMPRMINPKTSQFNGASDITGLCVDISDGDYNEIWATSSSVPYNGIVEYTKIK